MGILVYQFWSAAFFSGPCLRNFPCARSASSFPSPLLALAFVLPPSFYSAFPKSQRDSRWGVVGYDLRAGCDVRRGSQRCVGRGAWGAGRGVPAWAGLGWACRTVPGVGADGRCSSGRQADGRAGGQLASSFEGQGTVCRCYCCCCCGWAGRAVCRQQQRRRRRGRRSRKQPRSTARRPATGTAAKVNGSRAMPAGCAAADLELVAGAGAGGAAAAAAASAVALALQAWPGEQVCCVYVCLYVRPCV